jgi:hypothetical protein
VTGTGEKAVRITAGTGEKAVRITAGTGEEATETEEKVVRRDAEKT